MEWTPEVWAVFLDSDFGFSSDVLTSPSLQPKLPGPQEKGCVPRSSGGMANGEAAPARPTSFRKRVLLHPSWGQPFFGVRAPRGVGWTGQRWVSGQGPPSLAQWYTLCLVRRRGSINSH